MSDAKSAIVAVAEDANGYWWRVFDDGTWSMCPTNPDNSPIPTPVAFYVPRDSGAWARACAAAASLGAALAEFDSARELLAFEQDGECSVCAGSGCAHCAATPTEEATP